MLSFTASTPKRLVILSLSKDLFCTLPMLGTSYAVVASSFFHEQLIFLMAFKITPQFVLIQNEAKNQGLIAFLALDWRNYQGEIRMSSSSTSSTRLPNFLLL